MDQYIHFLALLEAYFQSPGQEQISDWKQLFLAGGCYWFASTLQKRIPGSDLMLNRRLEHCALYFDHGLYDVSGRISKKDFHPAAPKDISYMEKHYVPRFPVADLEHYILTQDCCTSTAVTR